MRQKPVTIEVRKNGQHWAVLAEEQLIALTVYEKGAQTLEAVLRGLLRYTSRKLFRQAVGDAMKGPKTASPTTSRKGEKVKDASQKAKAKSLTQKKPGKKEKVTHTNPSSATPSSPTESLSECPVSTQQDSPASH